MKTRTAHVLISRSCVNNCVFCTVADKRAKGLFLTKEQVNAFMRQCAVSGVRHFVFSGVGEPTLDPHFEEYLSSAGRLGFREICLFTNGHALTLEQARRWREAGLTSVLLSLHGMEQGHDRNVQREGAFGEAVRALDIYAECGFKVTVNTCLTRLNLTEIPQLRHLISHYPVKMHTLAFPEWSGNARRFVDSMLDYSEVVAATDTLVPDGDKITYFDNIPYCLVRRKTRELQGASPVRLLDGAGAKEIRPSSTKVFPRDCSERRCPLLNVCPGFEREYIATRGWGDLEQRSGDFLNEVSENALRAEIRSGGRKPSPTAVACGAAVPRPAHYHKHDLTVVMKTTSQCNAGCRYCSSRRQQATPYMSLDLVRRLYQQVFDYAQEAGIRRLTFLWHGGEPLLLGKSFYRDAWTESRSSQGLSVQHLMQSNLLLLDAEWVHLLRQFDVHLSTSVDPFGQDRLCADGRPQYHDWLERFILACEGDVHLGIVFTVMAKHKAPAAEVYSFLKNLPLLSPSRIPIRVNPVYEPSAAPSALDPAQLISPVDFGFFLYQLWQLWDADGRTLLLSPFYEWQRGEGLSCEFSGCCHEHFLAMDSEGAVYNCGRFADSGPAWGNIRENSLTSMLTSPHRLDLLRRATLLQEQHCSGCGLWKYCRGGCPYHAHLESGEVLRPSPFCEAYRVFFKESGLGLPPASPKEVSA